MMNNLHSDNQYENNVNKFVHIVKLKIIQLFNKYNKKKYEISEKYELIGVVSYLTRNVNNTIQIFLQSVFPGLNLSKMNKSEENFIYPVFILEKFKILPKNSK